MNIEWFHTQLIIQRAPFLEEIDEIKPDIIINVSDETNLNYEKELQLRNILHFWFPMNELQMHYSLSSIFASLKILYAAYKTNQKVLLHCQAGINRSPLIQECFYYLLTENHLKEEGRLLLNIKKKRLALTLEQMEKFIQLIKFTSDNPRAFIGGELDFILKKFIFHL